MNSIIRLKAQDIADMIDHSLLNPAFTLEEIQTGLAIAREYQCVSVCVRPGDVALSATFLGGSGVKVTSVVGFPHGSNTTQIKVAEARQTIAQGCAEIDMVLNIGRLLSGEYQYVEDDIRAVADCAHENGAILKVILENAYLTDAQKVRACELCARAGADYTKTSTGYAPGGATIHDLRLMRAHTPPSMGVKAAGGVRSLDDALLVKAAGGSRFGCTRTAAVMEDARKREAEGTLVLPVITEDTEFAALTK